MLDLIKINYIDVKNMIDIMYDVVNCQNMKINKKLFVRSNSFGIFSITLIKSYDDSSFSYRFVAGIYTNTMDAMDKQFTDTLHEYHSKEGKVSVEDMLKDLINFINNMYKNFGYDYKLDKSCVLVIDEINSLISKFINIIDHTPYAFDKFMESVILDVDVYIKIKKAIDKHESNIKEFIEINEREGEIKNV